MPNYLIPYGSDYFAGWVNRTREFSAGLDQRRAWLPGLCSAFLNEGVEALVNLQDCMLHGEYYPANILYESD